MIITEVTPLFFTSALALIVSIIVFYRNIKIIKESNTMSCLTELFHDYKKTMGLLNKALDDSKELEKYLVECVSKNDFSDFNKVYYDPKYNDFREVHYFFELLGSLAKQEEIKIKSINHFFSFPIEYFIETYNIRRLINENYCLPAYGANFCWLFVFYNNGRVKENRPWIANGKASFFSIEDTKKYSAGNEHTKM